MTSRRVAVVGAGIVGLSTAWFLQEHGFDVLVLDRGPVGGGASYANAGWIMPSRATPLTDPAALREGLVSLARPRAPLAISPLPSSDTWLFLARLARNCTSRRWQHACKALSQLNDVALAAYDHLTSAEAALEVTEAATTAVFHNPGQASHLAPGPDLSAVTGAGVGAGDFTALLSPDVSHLVRIAGTRHIEPRHFVGSLAEAIVRRGGSIKSGLTVMRVAPDALVETDHREIRADKVVIATGAQLGELGRPLGVRTPVRGGRGYSFTVGVENPVPGPVYLPHQRIACTPVGARLRVAGVMEFTSRGAPPNPRRFTDMSHAAGRMLRGIDWDRRADEWMGERPVTADGLPLIGKVQDDVYVAGGHGMWGITQGPATGMLLAEAVATGATPAALVPFDPLR